MLCVTSLSSSLGHLEPPPEAKRDNNQSMILFPMPSKIHFVHLTVTSKSHKWLISYRIFPFLLRITVILSWVLISIEADQVQQVIGEI